MSLNQRTRIDWADFTWNPVVGCSGSCPYCYARKIAHRFHRDFTPHWEERNFQRAMPWKPSRIFVDSMSDLADWESEWRGEVDVRMALYPQHLFLFLSKRPWECKLGPLDNVMLGYSATCTADLMTLARHGRPVDFLSLEPLLGEIQIPRPLLAWRPRWIIVGAETGNRRERVVPELAWLREIYAYCRCYQVPLFFKSSLRHLWPADVAFPQEYPA